MRICGFCGKEYESRGFTKYCSDKCFKANRSKVNSEKRSKRREEEWQKLDKSKKCKVCGESFEITKTHRNKIYCTDLCRSRAERLYGSKSETDLKYKDKIRFDGNREKALLRDNYECQMCGKKSQLVVHHKDCTGQSDDPNNELGNLVTLCRKCHINVHKILK